MTNIFWSAALAVASSIELSIIVKATVVLALAFLGIQLVRRAKASVRHALLASTFGVLLSLPLAAVLMPPLAIEIPMSPRDVPATTGSAVSGNELESAGAVSNLTPFGGVSTRRSVSALMLLRAAWAIGVALVLLYLTAALWRVKSIRRGGIPWVEGQALLRQLADEAGIRRRVDVLLHEHVVAPMTCGLVRPAIVLPADSTTWSQTDLQHALVHELEHVHRADWPVQLVARIVCGVYWFHPLAWTAWRRLSLEAERACDDAVLRCADRAAYAEQLLLLARRLLRADRRTVLSMANRSDLSARVEAVLDVDQARGRAGFVRVALFGAAAVLLVLFVSPLAAVHQATAPAPLTQGQTAAVDNLSFEVASIKPNKSGDNRVVMQGAPDRITATNVTVRLLIRTAYRVQDSQISGGPSWLHSDRFDIVAKAAGKPSQDGLQLMLRTLLADRFKLTTHTERTERQIYALVLARSDGRLGPRLMRRDCVTLPPARVTPGSKDPLQCNIIQTGSGRVNFRGALMSQIAEGLSPYVNRVVLDRTGLGGNYDVDLQWTPELFPPADGQPRPNDGAIGPDASSIFTALQEQLGLKLESTRDPVDVLVIDSVEQPTPD